MAEQTKEDWRLLNKDGSANVFRAKHRRGLVGHDLYHSLLRMSWARFFVLIVAVYLTTNVLFAVAYVLCGHGAILGLPEGDPFKRYLDIFFFSVQTIATIGYGRFTPATTLANFVVTIEALFGLLGLALATGLLFARFSRPTARVLFSNRAVINSHEGTPAFIIRIANERFNQIVEAQIRVVLLKSETTSEGERYRTLYDLELERNSTPVFGMTWTVVHYVTDTSPLRGLSHDDLVEAEAEFIVSVMGTDETIAQTIHARSSYTPEEVLWNMRFKDILSRKGGLLRVDMEHFHSVEPAFKTVPERL